MWAKTDQVQYLVVEIIGFLIDCSAPIYRSKDIVTYRSHTNTTLRFVSVAIRPSTAMFASTMQISYDKLHIIL